MRPVVRSSEADTLGELRVDVSPRDTVPTLNYAPVRPGKARLSAAVTLTLVICGTVLVIGPAVCVVWACTATYYNNTVELLAPFAWASVVVGAAMIAVAAWRGAAQRDART